MEFPEVRLLGFAEGWRAPEKRLVGLGCESGMEFPLSKNFNELQKIYEEAQRSSLNDKVKGMPMGACHRRTVSLRSARRGWAIGRPAILDGVAGMRATWFELVLESHLGGGWCI